MFNSKELALSQDSASIVIGQAVPAGAVEGVKGLITSSREVFGRIGDFQRRALLDMLTVTDRALALVAATDGLSREVLFSQIESNVPGLTKASLTKWAQAIGHLNKAGLTRPDQWTPGAASAAYALTGTGTKDAKAALAGVTVDSADGYVGAVVDALNAHPPIKAVKSTPEAPEAADVVGAAFTVAAFVESVRGMLDRVEADNVTEAKRALKALASSYTREAVTADA
jgi:hypothetical protein